MKLAILVAAAFLITSCGNEPEKVKDDKLTFNGDAEFVGVGECKSCHADQFNKWSGSHHDEAMKEASEKTVLGDFNEATFSAKGITSKFFKKDGDFYINTEGPQGANEDYKIKYTFGVFPLQQYIVEFPDGAYQCMHVAWDSRDKKWFTLNPDLKIHPKEWMHWSHGSMTWNNMCADCHSTNIKKNYDPATKKYSTTFDEINVACEACHGPGSQHVAYYKEPDKYTAVPELYMKRGMDSKTLVQKCARCHSRRSQVTEVFDFKGHFLDHYDPQLITEPVYYKDGQIRDEDYVYGSFVQSKMYHNKVGCTDCHDVHSLELKAEGNNLCMSCHKPEYNSKAHHFHEEETVGAQCVNCHMAGKNYMVNDFRRDHSFRVPRPDLTVLYGNPNACNGCHSDRSPEWTAEFIEKNYGPQREDHFSDHLSAGYNGNREALKKLISSEHYPEIARAGAMSLYASQGFSPEEKNEIIKYLSDESPMVRKEAARFFLAQQDPNYGPQIEKLQNDPVRTVRIAATHYLQVTGNLKSKSGRAFEEYKKSLDFNADFASGQVALAQFAQANNNPDQAIKHYERALEIDGFYNQARLNLALLKYQKGEKDEAERLYLKVAEMEPDFSQTYYMLGLFYNEKGESAKALKYMKSATEKLPVNFRAIYNYALMLQKEKRFGQSIRVVNKGLKHFPQSGDLLYIRLLGEMNSGRKGEAKKTCEYLMQAYPQNQNYKKLYEQLK